MRLFLFFLLVLSSSLYASVEGKIENNRIPSLRLDASLERSSLLYIAPVYDFIAVNFGLTSYKNELNGMVFGTMWQWLEGEKAAGTVNININTTTTRDFNRFIIGGTAGGLLNLGSDIQGLILSAESNACLVPQKKNIYSTEGGIGAYFSPSKHTKAAIIPGFGKNFGLTEDWFVNIKVIMEAYFWK